MEKIILIGGGGHCKSCIDVIEQQGKFQIAGVVDLPEKSTQSVMGYTVLGSDSNLSELVKSCQNVLITLGQIKSPVRRIELFKYLKTIGAVFPVIQSPLAYVSPHALVEEGTIVMHHALVNSDANVGRNCIINTKALVEHDAVVGDHCHVSTGAIVNGGVKIGNGSFFGSGAVSKEYISIPFNSFISANSLIAKTHD
jgi:sugar O-acyltransferase (sialic acid O-acetyltransferase NeuD family)